MNEGWISMHRKTMSHWIWQDPLYFRAWVLTLMLAGHKGKKLLFGSDLVEISRGQFITSRQKFADKAGMTEQQVRTFWDLLEKDKMITKQSTSRATRITVINYASYQDQQPADQPTDQPAGNQPATTTNKDNKGNKEINLNIRKLKFENDVKDYWEKYPMEMLREFARYWTEPNKSRTKMRWELQPTWSLGGRLATWYKNYQKNIPTQGLGSRREKPPKDYGVISPTAITREEYLKRKAEKNGDV